MIIYSKSGVRPHDDAIKAIRLLKKHGIVFIKDGKYVSVKSPSDDVLEDVFKNKRAYCMCEEAHKNEIKIPGCFNPFITCVSGQNNLCFLKKELYPIGQFFLHDNIDGVYYSNLTWVKKPHPVLVKGNKKNEDTSSMPSTQKETLNLFTSDFSIPYAFWSYTDKRWKRTHNKDIVEPYDYIGIFHVGRYGGWMINEDKIGIDFLSLPYGITTNKVIGKIEKYIMRTIKETKDVIRKQVAFNYYDKMYYEHELQSAWVVLNIAKMLKARQVKITRDTLMFIMKRIAVYRRPILDTSEAMDVYMIQHIEYIANNIL